MPTATTVPLLLLTIVLWRVAKGNLVSMVLFLSIFQAASAINLGAMGIAPWILILIVGIFIKSAGRQKVLTAIPNINTTAARLLLAFVCYAIFSGVVYPLLFRGVLVTGSHDSSPSPLTLGVSNVAQICYLLTSVVVFGLALVSSREALESALNWYLCGCVLASVFAMYQLVNAIAGVPYPSAILYSNPRYVIYQAYMINGMWRLNSTFTEASVLASHLSVGIALSGWNLMTRPLRWLPTLALALMVLTLLLTLSSTGYLSMIVILLTGSALSLRSIFHSRSLSRGKCILLLSFALVCMVAFITTNAAATIEKAIHSVLLDKEDSSSYRERMASNTAAMETARQTYYVGAGWGSVRCSSLGPGFLATIGLAGVLLFVAFLFSLVVPFFAPGYRGRLGDTYEKSLFGTLVILAAMMVAGNEPDQPILWVLFAACVAGPGTYAVFDDGFKGYGVVPAFHRPVRSFSKQA